MVASNHTRTRARVPSLPSKPASPTAPVAASCAQELDQIRSYLEAVNSTVAVAAGALEDQNADIDLDIAQTLRTSVRNVLADQVDRLTAVIRKLQ